MTLEGFRVVELGQWVAGPSAGGLLADWGADVIKVESPAGDPMRRLFAVLSGHGQTESPPFDLDNRGKRSVVFDLTTPEGREDALALVATADVFLTNLRPEAVDRLGLGADALLAANPRLVYASVTGYGREGPDAHRAGYDVGAFWARTGIARSLMPEDDAPIDIRPGMGDHVTGLTILSGILAALLQRERTGTGQLVETSLLRTGIYCVGWDLGIRLRFGKLTPTVSRAEILNPMVNCYRGADGQWFWLLGVESDRLWPKLVEAIDRPDLGADERFSSGRGRRHHAAEVITALDDVFAQATRAEWTERFDRHDVWWAPANTVADVLEDPQAVAAGAFVEVPGGESGPAHRAVATPITFSGGPDGRSPGPVPGLGEHTDAIRRELSEGSDDLR
jgi:crotonobetainyl-CoA:carnitine CoA-transferase CaiB-like acyl-CoA transferase